MRAALTHLRIIVQNDLRLHIRTLNSSKWGAFLTLSFPLGLFAIAQVVALAICFNQNTPPSLGFEAAGWLGVLLFVFSVSLLGQSFKRSDSILLLTSPVSAPAIVTARIVSIAGTSLFLPALFVLPLINSAILRFGVRYAAGYAVFVSIGLFCATSGLIAALGLSAVFGARRAQGAVKIVGLLLSALIAVSFQWVNQLGPSQHDLLMKTLSKLVDQPWILKVAMAGRGSPGAFFVLLGVVVISIVVPGALLGTTLLQGTQDELAPTSSARLRRVSHRWSASLFEAAYRKEVRLIIRDPVLLTQLLPALTYTLPMIFLGWRTLGLAVVSPLASYLAQQCSAPLVRIAAEGEEGWDLICCSPTPERKLRVAKLFAGITAPVTVCALLSLAVACLGHPWLALTTVLVSTAGAAAIGWLNAANIKPAPRNTLLGPGRPRHNFGANLISIVIMLGTILGLMFCAQGKLLIGACAILIGLIAAFLSFAFTQLEDVRDMPDEHRD